MSSPILRNIPHLTKDNGPPNGTEGREQGFSTFNHMSTDEQIPPCPKKIPINPSSTKIGNRGYTDHNGRRQGTGAPSQLNWGDVHPTGWGPEFYPEGETPGSPTEINSPTRYLIGAPPHKSQSSRRQSTRVRIPTWKAQEIKDMELLGKVRGLSYRVHKKSAKGSKKRQADGSLMSLAAKIIPSPAPPRNKFLEDNGDLIFPTLEELCGMTESDKEEWQRALSV